MLDQGKGGRGRGGCNLGKGNAGNSAFMEKINAPKSEGKGSAISERDGYKIMQNWSVLANPPSTNQFSEFSDPSSRDFDFWEPSNHISTPLHQISEFSEPSHKFSEFSEPFHQFSEFLSLQITFRTLHNTFRTLYIKFRQVYVINPHIWVPPWQTKTRN